MNRQATDKPRNLTTSTGVERVASRLANLYDAHIARIESLRVYPTTLVDVRVPSSSRADSGAKPLETRESSVGVGTKLWRRLRSAYAAHEARLAQLRVYDRERR